MCQSCNYELYAEHQEPAQFGENLAASIKVSTRSNLKNSVKIHVLPRKFNNSGHVSLNSVKVDCFREFLWISQENLTNISQSRNIWQIQTIPNKSEQIQTNSDKSGKFNGSWAYLNKSGQIRAFLDKLREMAYLGRSTQIRGNLVKSIQSYLDKFEQFRAGQIRTDLGKFANSEKSGHAYANLGKFEQFGTDSGKSGKSDKILRNLKVSDPEMSGVMYWNLMKSDVILGDLVKSGNLVKYVVIWLELHLRKSCETWRNLRSNLAKCGQIWGTTLELTR
uniref:Uncharacterized protein n=1 Tax=Vespula pensylvanica TaxID=30213 RepID=A0A834NKG0_VESPE|nr:hypothetical protein H0235_013701 [Vespula pensylvanica]